MNDVITPPPAEARRFFDEAGRLKQWPAKRKLQLVVLAHLAELFPPDRTFKEREVNEILDAAHTFGDPVSLRRSLIDERLLARKSDCSAYWRRVESPDSAH